MLVIRKRKLQAASSDLLDKVAEKHGKPGLLVVDYIQRFGGKHKKTRIGMNDLCEILKEITNSGWGVFVISATKRSTDGNHDHGQLDLSSLKWSGEIYFQLEVCYVLIKSIKGVHATCAKLVLHHDVMCIADKLGVFTPLCNLRSFDFGHV